VNLLHVQNSPVATSNQTGLWFLRPIALCDLFSTTSETRAPKTTDAERQ
jgi:hypothetical protein